MYGGDIDWTFVYYHSDAIQIIRDSVSNSLLLTTVQIDCSTYVQCSLNTPFPMYWSPYSSVYWLLSTMQCLLGCDVMATYLQFFISQVCVCALSRVHLLVRCK